MISAFRLLCHSSVPLSLPQAVCVSVCVCARDRERESVCGTYTEPAAPCLWLIMCLIICAISSEASRESFKLGLSVCLEYLLMMVHRPPPLSTLGSHTAVIVPASTTVAWEVTYKHTHSFGHTQVFSELFESEKWKHSYFCHKFCSIVTFTHFFFFSRIKILSVNVFGLCNVLKQFPQ